MSWSIITEGQKLFLAKDGKKLPQHQVWDFDVIRKAGASFSPQMKITSIGNVRKKFENLEDGPSEAETVKLVASLKELVA